MGLPLSQEDATALIQERVRTFNNDTSFIDADDDTICAQSTVSAGKSWSGKEVRVGQKKGIPCSNSKQCRLMEGIDDMMGMDDNEEDAVCLGPDGREDPSRGGECYCA